MNMVQNEIILSEQEIKRGVSRMAGEISRAYQGSLNAVAVVLLQGAKWFADDLLGQVTKKFDVEYLNISSYRGDKSMGEVKIEGEIKQSLSGKDVLLIDDIYDTGETLKAAVEYLKGFNPKSVRTCVFLEKEPALLKIVGELEAMLIF